MSTVNNKVAGNTNHELIMSLAKQAGYEQSGARGIVGMDDFLQKFAELLIDDCCRSLNPALRDMISRTHAVTLIKEHYEQSN